LGVAAVLELQRAIFPQKLKAGIPINKVVTLITVALSRFLFSSSVFGAFG